MSLELKVKDFLRKLVTCYSSLVTNKKGFTLIETVMIIVVVAIALPVIVITLGQEAKHSVDAELRVTATEAAQAIMEEIMSKGWDENSPIPPGSYTTPLGSEGGETKTACAGAPLTYDDVDDYNGYAETCSWGGINYATTVQVCYVPSTNLNDTSACNTATDYKRIQVTVTHPRIGSAELVTVMTNY